MLRIGDIHITAKWSDRILEQLTQTINQYPDEQDLVFFGDYVYHFTYDRNVLLQLFSRFIGLAQQGKRIYILAGNHDWIHDNFVYAEAQKLLTLLPDTVEIYLITEPTVLSIQGQDCLFFPYTQTLPVPEIYREPMQELAQSEHPGERISAIANTCLYDAITGWRKGEQRSDDLLVFHHWYIAMTQFPGQYARFSYKHTALSPEFARMEGVRLVSGHLHQPFARENYLCIGSVRHTSPLETNQQKYLFHYDVVTQKTQALPISINGYITRDTCPDIPLTQEHLYDHMRTLREKQYSHMQTSTRHVSLPAEEKSIDLAYVTLFGRDWNIGYDALPKHLDEHVLEALHDIKLTKKRQHIPELQEQLQHGSLALDRSIADWKVLLQRYLSARFGEEAVVYESLLAKLDIVS